MFFATDLTDPSLQYGAFGLCAAILLFCGVLWQSNRSERKELGAVIAAKDSEIKAMTKEANTEIRLLTEKTEEVVRRNTSAMNRLAEALESRPCLLADRVFRHGSGPTHEFNEPPNP